MASVTGGIIDTEFRDPELALTIHNALIIGEEFGEVLPQHGRAHGFSKNKRVIFRKL